MQHTCSAAAGVTKVFQKDKLPLLAICLAYLFNSADRQLLVILQEPIKFEFGLSDSQLGLLGLCFGLAYALGSFPLAMLTDRGWGGRVVLWTLAGWSAMTVVCGLSWNFVTLALARAGVGFWEGGCAPAAHALIGRIFPPNARSLPLALTLAAGVTGSAAASGLGGPMAQAWGWRAVFFILGVGGFVILPLVLLGLGREARAKPSAAPEKTSRRSALHTVAQFWRIPTLRYMALAAPINAAAAYGVAQWIGSFMIRHHGLTLSQTGFAILAGTAVGGIVGTLIVGRISDALISKDQRAFVRVPLFLFATGIPATAALAFSSGPVITVALYAWISMLALSSSAPIFALVQRLMPTECRAMAAAFILLLLNLIGLGGGPLFFGMVSDVMASSSSLPSLSGSFLTGSVLYVIATLFAFMALRHSGRDLALKTS